MDASSSSASAPAPSSLSSGATVLKEYGVIHYRGALTVKEQQALWKLIRGDCKARPPQNPIPANFHISSGDVGAPSRRDEMHTLGETLYSRFAEAVAAQLSPDEIAAEPSLKRIARVHSGEQPVRVDQVSGLCYQATSVLDIHQDGPMALQTLSVALGDACDFIVGQKPTSRKPFKNLRAGAPVTLRMESGDALFFDGGSVPHGIPKIHKGECPEWWNKAKPGTGSRVSVLFREADGWDKQFMS